MGPTTGMSLPLLISAVCFSPVHCAHPRLLLLVPLQDARRWRKGEEEEENKLFPRLGGEGQTEETEKEEEDAEK